MAGVRMVGAVKEYGATRVIHNVDLEIEDGEFAVFVGPSGCGKSTLLRMVAGLEDITDGDLERCSSLRTRAGHRPKNGLGRCPRCAGRPHYPRDHTK